MLQTMKVTLLAWLIVMVPLVAVAGPLEDADAAVRRHDYTTAIKLIRPLAENGNPVAQQKLSGFF